MYRKYINDLKVWLNSRNRKPLMVLGARQVGKSYLIKNIFAEEYFKNKYIYMLIAGLIMNLLVIANHMLMP